MTTAHPRYRVVVWPHGPRLRGRQVKSRRGETSARPAIVSGAAGTTSLTGAYPQSKFFTQPVSGQERLGVNVANGNLVLSGQDLSLPGVAGLGLAVGRDYNNLSLSRGAFGQGWLMGPGADSTLSTSCSNSNLIFADGSGAQTTFDDSSGATTLTAPAADLKLSMNGSSPSTSTQFTVLVRHSGITETLSSAGGSCSQLARLSTISDRHGNSIHYSYNGSGQLNQITDSYGNQTTVYYNAAGYVSQIDSPAGATSYYTQNAAGELSSYEDPDGRYTYYSYDASGDLTQIIDPDGNHIDIGYDSGNRVASIERYTTIGDTSGPTTTFQYWYPGAAACPAAATVQTGIFDPNNHVTNYCTDAQGRLLRINDANGNVRSTAYTPDGNVASQTQAVGTSMSSPTSFSYDTNDNVTAITDGTGSGQLAESFGYGDSSNPYLATSATDAQGNTNRTTYDSSGNPLSQTDGLSQNNQASETYNANGTVATSTDANGNVTNYGYTGADLTSVTPPSAAPLTALDNLRLTYDGSHRLATQSWINATYNRVDREIAYQYNNLGQVTQKIFTDTSGSQQIFTYSYDPNGNLVSETSPQGTSSRTYDGLGELTRQTYANGYNPISYSYDRAGNLASQTTEAGTTTYGYDAVNQLVVVRDMGNAAHDLSYDPAGNLTRISYPSGASVAYTYNPENQLLSTVDAYLTGSGQTATLSFQNTWTSSAGANTGLIQTTTQPDGSTINYAYDALNRLRTATTSQGTSTLAQYAYGLDGNGNLLTRTTTGPQIPNTQTSYAYNADNQTCWSANGTFSGKSCGSAPAGAGTFSYDPYGNETTSGSGMSLAYNLLGQLTSTSQNNSTQSYTYLGAGNNQLAGDNGLYMNNDQLGLAIHGDPAGGGDYFLRSTAGQPIEQITPHGAYDYIFDADGNVIGLISDSSGQLVTRQSYDPYGNITSTTGTAKPFFGFQGGYQTVSGLDHFAARYYSPASQLWTQQDPINQTGSLTENNRYGFAALDPVNLRDPSGDSVGCLQLHTATYCTGLRSSQPSGITGDCVLAVGLDVFGAATLPEGGAGYVAALGAGVTTERACLG